MPKYRAVSDCNAGVPWGDFTWQYGQHDGVSIEEEEENHLVPRYFGSDAKWRKHHEDDDNADKEHKRSRARGIVSRASDWMDNQRRSKTQSADKGRDGDRYRRIAPYGRRVLLQDISPPPYGNNTLVEKETIQGS
jgi:hypothetical protein